MHSHSKSSKSADKSNSKKITDRIKKNNSHVFDPNNVKKQLANPHNTLWVNLTGQSKGTRFLRVPYCLFAILAMDEAVFLARLLDLENSYSLRNRLQKNDPFFCSQSFLNKSFCITVEIQKRVIAKLKSRGYVSTFQIRFGKRFIHIERDKLEKDLVAAQNEIIQNDDGSPIVQKGSSFSRRGDHSKTRHDFRRKSSNDTKC